MSNVGNICNGFPWYFRVIKYSVTVCKQNETEPVVRVWRGIIYKSSGCTVGQTLLSELLSVLQTHFHPPIC